MWLIAEIIKIITPTDDQLTVALVLFGVGIVVSNIAVWRGVYLENDNFSEETKKSGWILLVRALAAEAAFAALLFVVDTTIGIRQEYRIVALNASNITLETTLEKEKQKTSMRPWTKEQFEAIQEIKGVVTDVGILWEAHCIECAVLGGYIESALHSAGARIYGARSDPDSGGTGIFVTNI